MASNNATLTGPQGPNEPSQKDISPQQEQEFYRQFLSRERPTIDAALKSFASWLMAQQRSNTADTATSSIAALPTGASQREILTLTRRLSKAINQHIMPLRMPSRRTSANDDKSWKEDIAAQVWNNLVAMKEKPTRHLGRTALLFAWQDICEAMLLGEDDSESNASAATDMSITAADFVTQFGRTLVSHDEELARLIWDPQGGKQELSRRATERNERAKAAAAAAAANQQQTPTIEELEDTIEELEE